MGGGAGIGGGSAEGAELVVCSVDLLPYCQKAGSVYTVAAAYSSCFVGCAVEDGKKLPFVCGAGSERWEVFPLCVKEFQLLLLV